MPTPKLDETNNDATIHNAAQQKLQGDMSLLLNEEEEEQYNSEEDEDFDVNAAEDEDVASEDEESESDAEREDAGEREGDSRPRKRRKVENNVGDGMKVEDEYVMGELESGDEVTIRQGEKMRKRKTGKEKGEEDEEEDEVGDFEIDEDEAGGEGGFVRTRAMRMKMQEEQRPLAKTDGATIDVDTLWAQMNADPGAVITTPQSNQKQIDNVAIGDKEDKSSALPPKPHEETIAIKRTYKFAGDVITEEKVVPKHSAEAKLYLASLENAKSKSQNDQQYQTQQRPTSRRPLRRISRFDPNPPDAIKKSWAKQAKPEEAAKGPKLNTVMKSKLDWATYVDREGIQDELNVHSKAKDSYLNRTDFLGRTEARKEEERRNLRLKNMG